MYYKTYCFAFQKRRFYTIKAAAFAMPKCSCHFFTELFLQTMPCFIADCKYLCKQQIETKNVKPCNVLKQTDFYLIEKCYF